MTDREMLEGVCDMFEAASREAENISEGRKGMQVPYQHEFAGTLHLPSVARDVRRWASTILAHLDGRREANDVADELAAVREVTR